MTQARCSLGTAHHLFSTINQITFQGQLFLFSLNANYPWVIWNYLLQCWAACNMYTGLDEWLHGVFPTHRWWLVLYSSTYTTLKKWRQGIAANNIGKAVQVEYSSLLQLVVGTITYSCSKMYPSLGRTLSFFNMGMCGNGLSHHTTNVRNRTLLERLSASVLGTFQRAISL